MCVLVHVLNGPEYLKTSKPNSLTEAKKCRLINAVEIKKRNGIHSLDKIEDITGKLHNRIQEVLLSDFCDLKNKITEIFTQGEHIFPKFCLFQKSIIVIFCFC